MAKYEFIAKVNPHQGDNPKTVSDLRQKLNERGVYVNSKGEFISNVSLAFRLGIEAGQNWRPVYILSEKRKKQKVILFIQADYLNEVLSKPQYYPKKFVKALRKLERKGTLK